ncbi:MAG: 1-acyl-sn-glycerol-3-phosphate acyltransferase [Pseudomonadota bacterium]
MFSIPFWGIFFNKRDPIAIDRSTPDSANASIKAGAQRMKEQGRPIIIFPQGTRVRIDQTTQDKPYKLGVARIQEATGLPIVPMAMNAGLFWPRNSWLKSSGTVIFEFLKPIEAGMERSELMAKLEKDIEDTSLSLTNEAKEKALEKRSIFGGLVATLCVLGVLLFGAYSFVWFAVADEIKEQYPLALRDLSDAESVVQIPEVTGYPGRIKMHVAEELLQSNEGSVRVTDLRAESWPIPGMPITVMSGPIEVRNFKWDEALNFDALSAVIKVKGQVLDIHESALTEGDFVASATGTADLSQEPIPLFDLLIRFNNHQGFLARLASKGIIENRIAMFMTAGLTSLANESGTVEVPLNQRANTLYAGPLPIMTLAAQQPFRARQRPVLREENSATLPVQPRERTAPELTPAPLEAPTREAPTPEVAPASGLDTPSAPAQ